MLPNLVIIGAMKSATSSLHHYLDQHPDVAMSAEKELHFFVERQNWTRGLAWYEAQFRPAAVRGESSPGYTFFPRHEGVPERMHGLIPDAKLIYLVRDPIERLRSHWVHFRHADYEKRPFAEAVLDPERPYLATSSYALQLERYLPFYPQSRIMVIEYERLARDRAGTMRDVFRFVGVDETLGLGGLDEVKNQSETKREPNRIARALVGAAAKLKPLVPTSPATRERLKDLIRGAVSDRIERPALTPEVRERLEAALAPDVARLRALTGQPFASWSL